MFLDIDDDIAENQLRSVCESFPLNSPLTSLIDSCLDADQRIKKARVVLVCDFILVSIYLTQEWLEKSAEDLVHEPPPMNKYSQLNIMNPDSQIGSKGAFYKLENDLDNSDQESLMKVNFEANPPSLLTFCHSGHLAMYSEWTVASRFRNFFTTSLLLAHCLPSRRDHGALQSDPLF